MKASDLKNLFGMPVALQLREAVAVVQFGGTTELARVKDGQPELDPSGKPIVQTVPVPSTVEDEFELVVCPAILGDVDKSEEVVSVSFRRGNAMVIAIIAVKDIFAVQAIATVDQPNRIITPGQA